MILPVADGAAPAATLFDRPARPGARGLKPRSIDRLDNDILRLRYSLV
jgi:hypothetical protein